MFIILLLNSGCGITSKEVIEPSLSTHTSDVYQEKISEKEDPLPVPKEKTATKNMITKEKPVNPKDNISKKKNNISRSKDKYSKKKEDKKTTPAKHRK